MANLGVNVYLDLVSRPLLSMYRQEMDADNLLIYLQRIYYARILFVCNVFLDNLDIQLVYLFSVLISTHASFHHFPEQEGPDALNRSPE